MLLQPSLPSAYLSTMLEPSPRRSPVGQLQLMGYGVAFLGVCWYNYQKLQGARPPVPTTKSIPDLEKSPLLRTSNSETGNSRNN